MSTTWRKVLADLAADPMRTLLAVLAMAAGAFGVAMIVTAYAVLARELGASYVATRPSAATLYTAAADDSLVALVRHAAGVADAEARPVLRGRVRAGDTWLPLVLFVVPDFDAQRMDRFRPVAGAWPPGDDGVLLERSALGLSRARIGGPLTVRLLGGSARTVRVDGTAHAPGLAPAFMDHVVTGFVGARSVLREDRAAETPAIRLTVRERPLDGAHLRQVATGAAAALAARGVAVTRTEIPPPGRHPHADQMDTFLLLLGGFALLTLLAGSALVAALLDALLARQAREIGMLKAVGASDGQVAALYLGETLALAALGLAPGGLAGVAAGLAYARFSATMLNLELASAAVPAWAVAVIVLAGLAVPLAAAAVPVRRAARRTVVDALKEDGAAPAFGARGFDAWLARRDGLPRPLSLGLRAAFRRRARLATGVALVAAGGAIFVAALDVAAAWTRVLAGERAARRYDADVRLAHPADDAALTRALAHAPLVARAERWAETPAELVGALPGAGDARVLVSAAPDGARALALPLAAGRGLAAGDDRACVVNPALVARVPGLRPGGSVTLVVAGRRVTWPVVGTVREILPMATVYVSRAALARAAGADAARPRTLRVTARGSGAGATRAAVAQLEAALAGEGIEVAQSQPVADWVQALADHLVIIRSALLLAAVLVLFVAALGLTSTLGVSVLERTREIGVLGALGASRAAIAAQVGIEGGLVALLGWLAALPLSVPVAWAFDAVTGQVFFHAPLPFTLSPSAPLLWLAVAAFLAACGSVPPALRAARLTVREALAHA